MPQQGYRCLRLQGPSLGVPDLTRWLVAGLDFDTILTQPVNAPMFAANVVEFRDNPLGIVMDQTFHCPSANLCMWVPSCELGMNTA